MDKPSANFFHGHTFCLVRLGMDLMPWLESGTGPAAKLFRTERSNINEEETIGDGRSRLNWFQRRHFGHLGRFEFHNATGYLNLR